MDLIKLILCILALFVISNPAVSEWKDKTTNSAEVVAGDEAYLESGVITNLKADAQNPDLLASKEAETYLIGKDIYSASLASAEDLSITDANGVAHKYGATTKQYITLPKGLLKDEGYNVNMAGYTSYDFSDSFDITPELGFGLSITDPKMSDSELSNLLNLDISADDSPKDLINKFLKSFGESGLGRNMDRFLEPNNLMYGAEFDRPNFESKNGVTCSWGESQKVSLDYSWLNGIGSKS
jgi:hypothetical protein